MIISLPKILRSPAGYYVGRTYFDSDAQAELPYERLSDYFRNIRQAEDELTFIFATLDEEEIDRIHEMYMDYINER